MNKKQQSQQLRQESEGRFFPSSLAHLRAELARMHLLVEHQVSQARLLQGDDSHLRGLVIQEQEVDALLSAPFGLPGWTGAPAPERNEFATKLSQLKAGIERQKQASLARSIRLRLEDLRHLFDLDEFDVDVLLVCLAPEWDLRYEKLYAYLQDDVTKKRPSVDLALNLLCPSFEDKVKGLRRFASESDLVNSNLIELFIDPSQPEPPLLRKFVKLDERIAEFLLEVDTVDARLQPSSSLRQPVISVEDLVLPAATKDQLRILSRSCDATTGQFCYLEGPAGVGRQTTAEALCHQAGRNLLVVEGRQFFEPADPHPSVKMRLLIREAKLQNAAILWRDFEDLLDDEKAHFRRRLFAEVRAGAALCFLTGRTSWEPAHDEVSDVPFMRLRLPAQASGERLGLWRRFLNGTRTAPDVDLPALSVRFRLNAGQIRSAVATAKNLAKRRGTPAPPVGKDDLYAACRSHSNARLSSLARKIAPRYSWKDIVLPPDSMEQLREICHQVEHRGVVHDQWGFGRKPSLGKGLNVLFAGPSGTGKTMAAEILAHELALDLYKIDLSSVVSKYIGETEKNLARIFTEAETSNAILLFDEADALFGKRSEVRDAHDRYANIEVGYLLQRMEEYEGIAILATNLRQNMDEAFVRRMHAIIEFPFPDEEYRRRIWEVAFPEEAPVGNDVDVGRLGREVRLAGGNIRNIALAAAFYAAGDGKKIRMSQLSRAARREHGKLGRTWNELCLEIGGHTNEAARTNAT